MISLLKGTTGEIILEALEFNKIFEAINSEDYSSLLLNLASYNLKELYSPYIVNGYLTCDHFKKLMEFLKTNNSITHLDLSFWGLNDAGAELISEMLLVNKSLTFLNLSYNLISDAGIKKLVTALKYNETLCSINFNHNLISAIGVNDLIELLNINKTLTQLYLGENIICSSGVKNLLNYLKYDTILISLSLSNSCVSIDFIENVQRLYVNNSAVERAENLLVEPEKLKNLLNFKNTSKKNNIFDNSVLAILTEVLKINNTIKYLDLAGNNLNLEKISFLEESFKLNTSLKALSLSNNNLQLEDLKVIANVLESSGLEDIDLSFNHIDSRGMNFIIKALSFNKLKTLNIGNNDFDEASMLMLAEHIKIKKVSNLEDLKLNYCKINKEFIDVISNIIEDLEYNLFNIDFCYCELTEEMTKRLLNSLKKVNHYNEKPVKIIGALSYDDEGTSSQSSLEIQKISEKNMIIQISLAKKSCIESVCSNTEEVVKTNCKATI